MPDIFISYAREDQPFAKGLTDLLHSEGLEVWWDAELYAGQQFPDEIEKQIRHSTAVICVWSKASVLSDWVVKEARLAIRHSRLLPVMLGKVDLPNEFSSIHTVPHRSWGSTIMELTRALNIDGFLYHARSTVQHRMEVNPLFDREKMLALFQCSDERRRAMLIVELTRVGSPLANELSALLEGSATSKAADVPALPAPKN